MPTYLLYPPFLKVNEEVSFSDTWESFCLKLLKLEYGTTDIERRRPPEKGIDLYYKDRSIAYQCKSTLKNSKFNITNACKSLNDALELKNTLPWREYVICSNENFTGEQISKLHSYEKSVICLGKDYWISICERFPDQVRQNFRVLCDIPDKRIGHDINLLINGELDLLNTKMRANPINVLLYSFDSESVYNIKLSLDLTVADVLLIIRRIFNLQEATSEHKGEILINPYFMIGNDKIEEEARSQTTLGELGIKNSSVICFGLEIVFVKRYLSRNIMFLNKNSKEKSLEKKDILEKIFTRFNNSI